LAEEAYVRVNIFPEAKQLLDNAKDNLQAAIDVCGGKMRPLLVDIRGCQPLDPEARRYYSGQVLVDHFCAQALLVDITPFGRFMANLYLQVAQPKIPSQLFTNEEKAVKWLRGFVA
jgi:hypothetical protein